MQVNDAKVIFRLGKSDCFLLVVFVIFFLLLFMHIVLKVDPLSNGSQIIAQVQTARRLDARQNATQFGSWRIG